MTALKPNTTQYCVNVSCLSTLWHLKGTSKPWEGTFWNNDVNTECLLHVDVQPRNKGGGATLFPSHLDDKVCGKRKRLSTLTCILELRLTCDSICVSFAFQKRPFLNGLATPFGCITGILSANEFGFAIMLPGWTFKCPSEGPHRINPLKDM